MLKYYNYQICFEEVPDEIVLAINIAGCKNHCAGCHSPWLQEDVGIELTEDELDKIIVSQPAASCVAIMGGDADAERVICLCKRIHEHHKLKTAWYSGKPYCVVDAMCGDVDYYKFGPYVESRGPLNEATTNQVMLKYDRDKNVFFNITGRFQK